MQGQNTFLLHTKYVIMSSKLYPLGLKNVPLNVWPNRFLKFNFLTKAQHVYFYSWFEGCYGKESQRPSFNPKAQSLIL